MKYFLSIALLSGWFLLVASPEQSPHRRYLQDKLSKLLVKAKYEVGIMYTYTDTIVTEMMLFKHFDKSLKYEYCIFKSTEGKIKFYTASELQGYKLNGEIFKQHVAEKDTFFIKELETGRIRLYKREAIPSSHKQIFYIKFPAYDFYFTFCPDDEYFDSDYKLYSESILNNMNNSTSKMYHVNSTLDDRFNIFVGGYMGNCIKVKNLVKAGLYTINDLEEIIALYNDCF